MRENAKTLPTLWNWTLFTLAVAVFLISLGATGPRLSAVGAQPPKDSRLRVGVTPTFPPMVFKKDKTLVGAEVDLARALGEHLGRPVEFIEIAWDDQIEALTKGRTDIIMSSMTITPARRFAVSFAQPYLKVGQMALVRREDKHKYTLGFPVHPPGPVGVLKSTTGDFLVQRDFVKPQIKAFESESDAARALLKKKIDLFVADSTLVWYLAGQHASDGLTVVPIALSEELLAWAVNKGDEALLKSVNGFLAQAAKDGTLDRVFKRWTAIGD